jgi:hypothetical protein
VPNTHRSRKNHNFSELETNRAVRPLHWPGPRGLNRRTGAVNETIGGPRNLTVQSAKMKMVAMGATRFRRKLSRLGGMPGANRP